MGNHYAVVVPASLGAAKREERDTYRLNHLLRLGLAREVGDLLTSMGATHAYGGVYGTHPRMKGLVALYVVYDGETVTVMDSLPQTHKPSNGLIATPDEQARLEMEGIMGGNGYILRLFQKESDKEPEHLGDLRLVVSGEVNGHNRTGMLERILKKHHQPKNQ